MPRVNSIVTTQKKLNEEQTLLIKNTVAKGATDDELKLFIAVANRSGLDPFTRQVHFIKRKTWNKDLKKYEEVGTIQTGIDGYRAIAARTGEHAGTDDAIVEERDDKPIKATVTVYRMIQGQRVPYTATARFSEYVQLYENKPMGLWGTKPFLMISKVAECLALRKAFPNVLSDIYAEEEMPIVETPTRRYKTPAETKIIAEVRPEIATNSKKTRIVLLMKKNGIQPTDDSVDGWKEAVKAASGLDLIEDNYDRIIEILEMVNNDEPPLNEE